ncbi:glycosyltransferase family 39 protein, partial [Planctomycetota bacterium]
MAGGKTGAGEEERPEAAVPSRRALVVVFAAALAVRLLYLCFLSQSPLFDSPTMDPAIHDDWAYGLAGRGPGPSDAAYLRAPLYPYFLSLFYRLFDRSFSTYVLMRIGQHLLGAVSCALIYLLALRLHGRREAMVASAIAILYWPFVYFEGELLIPALLIPLILAGFVVVLAALRKGEPLLFFAGGVFFGLAAITRPNILLYFPILAVYVFARRAGVLNRNAGLRDSGLLALGIMGCILPVTVRNYVVGDDLVLISSQAGVNFYIGNNELSDAKTAVVPGTRATWWGGYLDTVRIAERNAGRTLRPSEVSQYWFRKGLRFLADHPGKAAKLYVKKARYLL